MHEHVLTGCRPVPLASYLKALGILRLVSQQIDSTTRGWWRGNAFMLRSALGEEALLRFFLEQYQPTPIIAPWNGGSGFYDKDNTVAINAISVSNGRRF